MNPQAHHYSRLSSHLVVVDSPLTAFCGGWAGERAVNLRWSTCGDELAIKAEPWPLGPFACIQNLVVNQGSVLFAEAGVRGGCGWCGIGFQSTVTHVNLPRR